MSAKQTQRIPNANWRLCPVAARAVCDAMRALTGIEAPLVRQAEGSADVTQPLPVLRQALRFVAQRARKLPTGDRLWIAADKRTSGEQALWEAYGAALDALQAFDRAHGGSPILQALELELELGAPAVEQCWRPRFGRWLALRARFAPRVQLWRASSARRVLRVPFGEQMRVCRGGTAGCERTLTIRALVVGNSRVCSVARRAQYRGA